MRLAGAGGLAVIILSVAALSVSDVAAQTAFRPPVSDIDPELMKIEEVKYLGFKLDERLSIIGGDGKEFTLGQLKGKPLILIFSYFTCDGLCPAFNADLLRVLKKVVSFSRVKPGVDFNVLTISFDNSDDAKSAEAFMKSMNIPDSLSGSWRVGVFKDQRKISKTSSELGFRFFWSQADRVFLHPNVYYFITPDLRVARILNGAVAEPRDMELAILESKFDKLKPSEALNLAFGLCYSYNYKDGKYRLNYPMFISLGSLVTGAAALLVAVRVYKRKAGESGRA